MIGNKVKATMGNMNYFVLTALSVLFVLGGPVSCSTAQPSNTGSSMSHEQENQTGEVATATKMKIKIGSRTFTATLFENATANAIKAMLPLTLEMDEMNGNEKKYDFTTPLPTDPHDPKRINSGDLMLWGKNTLVLFYKTFPTQYSYTKVGRVDDPAGLDAALGSGDVSVTFELE